MGGNDNTNNVYSGILAGLNQRLSSWLPDVTCTCCFHFRGEEATNLQAAITALTDPARFTYVDTPSVIYTGANVHPTATDNVITNSALIGSLLRFAGLAGATTTVTKPPFRLGFH